LTPITTTDKKFEIKIIFVRSNFQKLILNECKEGGWHVLETICHSRFATVIQVSRVSDFSAVQ